MREGLVILQNHRMGKESCWVEMRREVPRVVTGEDVAMSKAGTAWDREQGRDEAVLCPEERSR